MASVKVVDVLVSCYATDGCYLIAELSDGRFAFTWGNVITQAGKDLQFPARPGWDAPVADLEWMLAESTADMGVSVHDTYESAERAYRECAAAIGQCSERAEAEMVACL